MEMDEEEEEEELHFFGQELMKIRDAIAVLVQSLLHLLQTFPLKDRTQSASNCTQVTPPTPTLRPAAHHLSLGAARTFLSSPQIFIKLLYFEPVLGELTFAAPR